MTASIEKVFSGSGDPKLPSNVRKLPKKDRAKWSSTWNSVFRRCMKDKRTKRSTCESRAFSIANGTITSRERAKSVATAVVAYIVQHGLPVEIEIDLETGIIEVLQPIEAGN